MRIWISKHWTAFGLICLAAGAIWIGLTAFSSPSIPGTAAQTGFLAPSLELNTAQGETVNLAGLRGKAIVLNFWASWCEPCKQEMPALQKAYETYASQGVIVIGVNVSQNDQISNALQFAQSLGITFPILLDEDGQAGKDYRISLLPTTFFIERDGTIHSIVRGGMPDALIFATIEELLPLEVR